MSRRSHRNGTWDVAKAGNFCAYTQRINTCEELKDQETSVCRTRLVKNGNRAWAWGNALKKFQGWFGLRRWCWWHRTRLPLQETQETWVWSLGWEDPLEEGVATHSNILAWRIPTDQPTGFQRVGHSWSNLPHMHAKLVYTGFSARIPFLVIRVSSCLRVQGRATFPGEICLLLSRTWRRLRVSLLHWPFLK